VKRRIRVSLVKKLMDRMTLKGIRFTKCKADDQQQTYKLIECIFLQKSKILIYSKMNI